MKTYAVKEVFYSLQGEGARSGSANVFVRFAGCDLQCSVEREGFDCDTDFIGGERFSASALVAEVSRVRESGCLWVILTGGEPALQVDDALIEAFHAAGYMLAIETNGKHQILGRIDYIAVSPKRGHPCVLLSSSECRIVLGAGQEPDENQRQMAARSPWVYVSPAAAGETIQADAMDWCVEFVKRTPAWRLSLQTHKVLGIR